MHPFENSPDKGITATAFPHDTEPSPSLASRQHRSVLIPQRLRMYGFSQNALSLYGIFTGMALPCSCFLPRSQIPLLSCSRRLSQNCRRSERTGVSAIYPDRAFFLCLFLTDSCAGRGFFIFSALSRELAFSQQATAGTVHAVLFPLSVLFFIQTPCSPASLRALENRSAADPQCCRHSHPYFVCCFCNSGNWNTRLFLRDFSG